MGTGCSTTQELVHDQRTGGVLQAQYLRIATMTHGNRAGQ
jgi:hypothetical protein